MGNALFGGGEKPDSFAVDELTFCHQLPDLVDIECPICLQVMLYDPCLVSCCGHHFCSYCILQAKKSNSSCPYCKTENYDTMADKGLERIIKSLKVKCTRKAGGCNWEGELIHLVDHLTRDKREGECPFAVVNCKYSCGHQEERCKLDRHETQVCSKRPYQCTYCGHKSTYSDITNEHIPTVCQRYPIPCPNSCCKDQIVLERRFMKKHVADECPLTHVSCDYKKDGCGWRGQRQDLENHYYQDCSKHLQFVNERTNKLEEENKSLKREIKELNNLVKAAASELRRQSHDIDRLKTQIKAMESNHS